MHKEYFVYEKKNSLYQYICDDVIELLENKDTVNIESEKLNIYLHNELNKNINKYINNKLKYINNDKISTKSIISKEIMSKNNKTNKKIPYNIIQTYTTNIIDKNIKTNIIGILKKNPEYNYLFITDNDAKTLIKRYFDNNTLNAFNRLKMGSAKGNFISYIALYVYGGIYLDLHSDIKTSLNDFIPKEAEFLFFYNTKYNIEFTNSFIISFQNNNIIKDIIHEMVTRINNYENNLELATGKNLFIDVIYNKINNTNIYNFNKNLSVREKFDFLNYLENNPKNFNGLIMNTNTNNFPFLNYFNNYCSSMLYNNIQKSSNIFEDFNIDNFKATKYSFNGNNNLLINNKNSTNNMYFVWFLNDYDGEIVFSESLKIKPEKFKLLLFPNTWYFQHEEFINKQHNKYIIDGYFNIDI